MKNNQPINIISTLGPSTESEVEIRGLFDAGCRWFRMNINHGNPQWHEQAVAHVRSLGKETNTDVGFFFDLGGPKVRIGDVSGDMHTDEHDTYIFTLEETLTSRLNNKITIQEKAVIDVLEPGDTVTIGDACITFEITERVCGHEVAAKVLRSGVLASRRGIAVPGKFVDVELLTQRDKEFIQLAHKNLIRYFALSFVQTPEDVLSFREYAKEIGIPKPFVIVKIETMIGVQNIEAIAKEADLIMVARGDLMIDTGIAAFGKVVDQLIEQIQKLNVPFIIATEVMSSMIENPSPSRADVMNVYRAKKDGVWGIMLSNETAIGKYPVECVQTVRDILDS